MNTIFSTEARRKTRNTEPLINRGSNTTFLPTVNPRQLRLPFIMTRLLHFILATLSLAFWIKHCAAAIYSTQTWAGTQYIFFNGTITGTVNYPSSCSPSSESYGPYIRTYLYVGVNPPWDSNPFYFELYHLASEGDGFIVITEDYVYNLDFAGL